MLSINLNRQEAQLITQLFRDELEDLRVEVRHTDRLEYKEELKEKERLLQGLIIKLEHRRYEETIKVKT